MVVAVVAPLWVQEAAVQQSVPQPVAPGAVVLPAGPQPQDAAVQREPPEAPAAPRASTEAARQA